MLQQFVREELPHANSCTKIGYAPNSPVLNKPSNAHRGHQHSQMASLAVATP